ncbi:MAG: DUF1800 domain-containing protein [Acidobacteriota bacterium]|nr:DUF1800 domain-containing protein [Acidobacteriota bacterium]
MRHHSGLKKQVVAYVLALALNIPMLAVPSNRPSIPAKLTENQRVLHVLNRLGFGPREGDIERVKTIGLNKYIEQQLNPSSIPDKNLEAVLKNFEILDMSTAQIFAKYPNPGALIRRLEGNGMRNQPLQNENGSAEDQQAERRARRQKLAKLYQEYGFRPANQIMLQVQSSRIIRAAYSERQLEEVMVDFWANHFNVYSQKAATRWYIPSYERDVIRKHALGNFRDLVTATAQHPAMLFYLDNFQSVSPDASASANIQRLKRFIRNGKLDPRVRERMRSRGLSDQQIDQRVRQIMRGGNNERGINENYARELMELHTLGVDGGYTAEDIQNVARAFTGWSIFDARGYRKASANMVRGEEDRQIERQARRLGIPSDTESGSFVFVNSLHDKAPKIVLGQKVDEGGIKDGLKVIDILVKHPSTARFIAKKLAVKFVNDEPSEKLVNAVAKAFTKSDGDIKTTLRALFTSDEFFAAENYRAKIKTPFELLVSSVRALDARLSGARALVALLNRMGEPLYGYQAPTGYPDTAADWVNTGALLERMNFAVALASNRLPQTYVDLNKFAGGSQKATLERTVDLVLHGEISGATRSTVLKQLENPLPGVDIEITSPEPEDNEIASSGGRGRNRQARLLSPRGDPEVFKVVGLILGSPDFQRQ